jgi:RimJ/RimL family protein N-acetyltransferase
MTDLSTWKPCLPPDLKSVTGRYVRIDPVRIPGDNDALFSAFRGPENEGLWTYMPFGPFSNADELGAAIKTANEQLNWQTHVLRDAQTSETLGMASYMRIRPDAGSVEIGAITFSKKLQKTPAVTEAMYLMARHIFDKLGYRRYEWKCNNENEASKRAALRLGFTFEGVFRQDMIVKGKNRDTAWYSMLDSEWPAVKAAMEVWLAPENFDAAGRQRQRLQDIRTRILDGL